MVPGRGGQPALPPTAAGSVVTPWRVAALSPEHPFFMPCILLLADNRDAEELPGLEREQPSPVTPMLPVIFGGKFSPTLSREIIAR